MGLVSLETDRELFRSFIQMCALASGWIDRNGTWLSMNTALCELSGYADHEWLIAGSIGPVLLMIEDRVVSPMELISEYQTGCQAKMIHKKGFTEVELHWNEITLPSGKTNSYMVQFKEALPNRPNPLELQQQLIKESKLERALYVSKQHYKSLFEHHPDAVFSLDLQGRFITLNESCERIAGYTANELFQTLFVNRLYSEDWAMTYEYFRLAASGQAQDFSTRVIHKNGNIIEFHIYFLPIAVDGDILGVYGIAKDITQEKRLNEKLRANEEMYRSIEENSFDLIFRYTLQGIILYSSPASRKMLGYEQQELLDQEVHTFIHPDDQGILDSQLRNQCKNGIESNLYCYRFRHKTGRYIWLETMTSLVRDVTSGSVASLLCVSRDISERKTAEDLLLRSEKLLMAGQLAAGIAHEIRNPLTSLKGFLQLLSSQMRDKQDYMDIMRSELNRIEAITSELLLLAKPHAQSFSEKEMNGLLVQVVAIMEPQAILNNVQLEGSFLQEGLYIRCDENQLKQVFVNFIKNAIEAMPTGGVVKVKVEEQNSYAVVSIQDQGCGIPEEKLANIWQPFYTTKEKGTGLGLMVSYSIIENHNGSVHVTSQTNVGSNFTVRIPLLHSR